MTELLKPENERLSSMMFAKPVHSMIDSDDDSDDEDMYEPNQAEEAERAFRRYLNERINVDLPEDYGVDDSDDSDDEDSFVYGTSVGFSSTVNYSTDLTATANGISFQGEWSMEHPSSGLGGGAAGTDLSATVTLASVQGQTANSDDDDDNGYLQVNGTEEETGGSSEDEGEAAVGSGADNGDAAGSKRPPAISTTDMTDSFETPDDTSTPRDAPENADWANFGGGDNAAKNGDTAAASVDSTSA